MSDSALENAKASREQLLTRREALKAELTRIDKDLAEAEDFIYQWYRFAGVEPVENLNIAGTPMLSESPIRQQGKKAVGNSKKEDVAAEVRKILEERGEPVSRKELMTVLVERGFKIEGSDPDMVLSTMLWRMREKANLERLKTGGYWLADKPNPLQPSAF